MREIVISRKQPIPIGRVGEKAATLIKFNINSFFPRLSGVTYGLYHQPPGAVAPHPCTISTLDGFIYWYVDAAELTTVGSGVAQLVALKDTTVVVKSLVFTTEILNSIGMVAPPASAVPWADAVLRAGVAAQDSAVAAAGYAAQAQALLNQMIALSETLSPFWAVYGETTSAEIEAAYQAGRICLCRHTVDDNVYICRLEVRSSDTLHIFCAVDGAQIAVLTCWDDAWRAEIGQL